MALDLQKITASLQQTIQIDDVEDHSLRLAFYKADDRGDNNNVLTAGEWLEFRQSKDPSYRSEYHPQDWYHQLERIKEEGSARRVVGETATSSGLSILAPTLVLPFVGGLIAAAADESVVKSAEPGVGGLHQFEDVLMSTLEYSAGAFLGFAGGAVGLVTGGPAGAVIGDGMGAAAGKKVTHKIMKSLCDAQDSAGDLMGSAYKVVANRFNRASSLLASFVERF